MVKRGDMMSVDDVTEILAVNLLGVIPTMNKSLLQLTEEKPLPEKNVWPEDPTWISAAD